MSHAYHISANEYQSKGPKVTNATSLMASFNALPNLFQERKKRRVQALNSPTSPTSVVPGGPAKKMRNPAASSVWDAGRRTPGTQPSPAEQPPSTGEELPPRSSSTTPMGAIRQLASREGGVRLLQGPGRRVGTPNDAQTTGQRSLNSRGGSRQGAHQAGNRKGGRSTMGEEDPESFLAPPPHPHPSGTTNTRAVTPFQQLKRPAEGLMSADAFGDRQAEQYSNLFPTSKEEATLNSTTKTAIKTQTAKPEFLHELELKIEAELSTLRDHGGSANAKARLYLEALGQLGQHLPTYQPILTLLKREMEGILMDAEQQQMRATGAQSDYVSLKSAYDTDVSGLKAELADTEGKMRAELERIDMKQKQRSTVMLIYDVEDLQKQLAEARTTIDDLQQKLVATNRVRAEFERTMRSIEDTFNLISDEKDLQISKLRTEAAMEHAESVSAKRKAHTDISALADRVDTVTIAHRVCSKQNTLLTDRCKDLGSHLNTVVQQLQMVEAERDGMEERLAAFEGNPNLGVRNPTMTPRPNKSEAITRIPLLGDIQQFASTASMMAAIYELHDQLQRKIQDWEQLYDDLDTQVENRFNERMEVEAERAKQEAVQRKKERREKREQKEAEDAAAKSLLKALGDADPESESPARPGADGNETSVLSINSDDSSAGSEEDTFCQSASFFCGNTPGSPMAISVLGKPKRARKPTFGQQGK